MQRAGHFFIIRANSRDVLVASGLGSRVGRGGRDPIEGWPLVLVLVRKSAKVSRSKQVKC